MCIAALLERVHCRIIFHDGDAALVQPLRSSLKFLLLFAWGGGVFVGVMHYTKWAGSTLVPSFSGSQILSLGRIRRTSSSPQRNALTLLFDS
eukprot:gene6976-4940_t